MITKAIRDFLTGCPGLSGQTVNLNYLGHMDGDLSLEPRGDITVVKTYCDGKGVFARSFRLLMRCGFDGNTSLNLEDEQHLDDVANWISANLPKLPRGFSAIKTEITMPPQLHSSSTQGAALMVEFKLIYKEI